MKRRVIFNITLAAALVLGAVSLEQAQSKADELELETQRRDPGHRGEEPADREPGPGRERNPDPERERSRVRIPASPEDATRREMDRLRDKLEESVANGRESEAAKIKEELARLNHDLALHENLRAKDREQAARREQEIAEHRANGREEEARRLEREWRGPREPRPGMVEGEHRDRIHAGSTPDSVGETQRRLHHLTVAIENLRLAGFPEPAERLEREAGQLRRRLEGGGGEARREERRVIIRNESGPMPPWRELHGQMEEMRAQMEEMRRALKEVQQQLKERP